MRAKQTRGAVEVMVATFPSDGRLSAGLAVVLRHGELGAGCGFDPSDRLVSESDELLDIEGYADDIHAGTLQCFELGRDGSAVRRQIGPGDALADLAKAGVILLVRPQDGHERWSHGILLSIVAGNTIIAGGESATTALPEGEGTR